MKSCVGLQCAEQLQQYIQEFGATTYEVDIGVYNHPDGEPVPVNKALASKAIKGKIFSEYSKVFSI